MSFWNFGHLLKITNDKWFVSLKFNSFYLSEVWSDFNAIYPNFFRNVICILKILKGVKTFVCFHSIFQKTDFCNMWLLRGSKIVVGLVYLNHNFLNFSERMVLVFTSNKTLLRLFTELKTTKNIFYPLWIGLLWFYLLSNEQREKFEQIPAGLYRRLQ